MASVPAASVVPAATATPFRRLAVVIPTWNEAGNVDVLVESLFALDLDLGLEVSVWVMDDGSTDGTLEALDAIAARRPLLHVVRRPGPRGYGRSCVDGLLRALGDGADLLLQMDGDLSHDPQYVSALLAAASRADLVLGSRYANGISVVNWSLSRLLLSTAANRYVRALAGLPLSDCTTGYRLWRRALLERLRLSDVRSEGYSFLVEMLFRASRAGARIEEVPIVFVERRSGTSKLSGRVVVESALLPWKLLAQRFLDALR